MMYPVLNRREFVLTSAAASLAPLSASPTNIAGHPLLAKVRLGAEFFLNRSETRESVFGHFRAMRETGLTVARIFTLWDQVEREQGKWNFTGYDWIYDAAAENGILIANTLCSEDPPGWLGGAQFYHAWKDLSNPKLRPYSEIYLEKIVNRYKGHAAHGVWLLQNEPGIDDNGRYAAHAGVVRALAGEEIRHGAKPGPKLVHAAPAVRRRQAAGASARWTLVGLSVEPGLAAIPL